MRTLLEEAGKERTKVPAEQPRELRGSVATRGRTPLPRAKATTVLAVTGQGVASRGCGEGGGAVFHGSNPPKCNLPPGRGLKLRKTRASNATPRPPRRPRPALGSSANRLRAPSWLLRALLSDGARSEAGSINEAEEVSTG